MLVGEKLTRRDYPSVSNRSEERDKSQNFGDLQGLCNTISLLARIRISQRNARSFADKILAQFAVHSCFARERTIFEFTRDRGG